MRKLASTSPPKPTSITRKDSVGPEVPLERPFSTLAVSSSTGKKKRNKLGYHRASIACSHCRRRKIRCIVSRDVQKHCVNCLRLKKECSFNPVDEKHKSGSKARSPPQDSCNNGVASHLPSSALAHGHEAGILKTVTFMPQPQYLANNTDGPAVAPPPVNVHSLPTVSMVPVLSADQLFPFSKQDVPWLYGELSIMPVTDSAGLGMRSVPSFSGLRNSDQNVACVYGSSASLPEWA